MMACTATLHITTCIACMADYEAWFTQTACINWYHRINNDKNDMSIVYPTCAIHSMHITEIYTKASLHC